MFIVKTLEEVLSLLDGLSLPPLPMEQVPLLDALGRILGEDVVGTEYIPSFHRSTMDGYALQAVDTFGCSDSIPAILDCPYTISMGEETTFTLQSGQCAAIPTGGQVPQGADSVQMLEYAEDYGDGTMGILKSVAPGQNMIFKGDDLYPDKLVLSKGHLLTCKDIGAMAAMGLSQVTVQKRPVVGILSTGDELVPVEASPKIGQIRDVNSTLLAATVTAMGAVPQCYGILQDQEDLLRQTVAQAVSQCDVVLLSGGSSVGIKDASFRVLQSLGTVLFHGIAMKPGKPTLLATVENTPVFGLPGHPVAAFFVTELLLPNILSAMIGRSIQTTATSATLTETVEANHGRTQCVSVVRTTQDGKHLATPIRNKSGLITTLSQSNGYFLIPRDCEGYPKGATVSIYPYG